MRRPALLRSALPACVITAVLAAGLLPTVADARAPRAKTTNTRIAPGVTLSHSTFTFKGKQRVFTLHVRLDGHTQLVAGSPNNVIGAPRMTGLAIGRQQHAVAGINGDTFYFFDSAAVPRGGISTDGRILKSALLNQNAVLYVTNNGRAAIGNPGYSGRVNGTDANGHARSFKITSINSIENAVNGGMSLIDPLVLGSSLQKRPHPKHTCAIVRLNDAGGDRFQVAGISYDNKYYGRAAAGTHALVSCASTTKTWIRSALTPGQTITANAGYAVHGITTLLSGNKQLIRNGKRFNDRTGLSVYGNRNKPETFGCVLRDNRSLLLGVVEGDRPGRAGMTYATLATYLLTQKCRSALVFDGSGSSTLVAQRPGHGLAVMNKMTAPGGVRKLVNGLYVVRR